MNVLHVINITRQLTALQGDTQYALSKLNNGRCQRFHLDIKTQNVTVCCDHRKELMSSVGRFCFDLMIAKLNDIDKTSLGKSYF